MTNGKYICWGSDHEDLTEEVRKAEKESLAVTKYAGSRGNAARTKGHRKWRVIVRCSEGHENIFEGED